MEENTKKRDQTEGDEVKYENYRFLHSIPEFKDNDELLMTSQS